MRSNEELIKLIEELKKENAVLREEKETLNEEKEKLEVKKEKLEVEKERLEKQKSQLEDKNTKLEDKNTKLEDKNAELEDKNTELEDKNLKLEEHNSKLEEHNSKLEEHNSKLEEHNSKLEKKNLKLEKENTKLEKKVAKLEVKIYEINKKLNEAQLINFVQAEKEKIARIKPFLSKGEKLNDIVINEPEEIIKEEKKERKTNKGKKYKKKPFDYEKYVTETKIIEPGEKICETCGATLVEATSKIRYVVEVIPSKIKVTKIIKKSYKCPKCNKENNKIYYPLSNEVFGGILTPSLATYILYHKYELGIPFEHLAKHISKSIGFEISKQNLANYTAKACEQISKVYEKMRDDLLHNNSKVIHSDETTLVVSKKKESDKSRKKSYVYVYTSSYYDKNQIRIYDFHESRSIDKTTTWLKEYKGYIISDNFEGYNKLKKENPNIKLQKCWAHVRRRYADIIKNIPEAKRKDSLAFQILKEISKLFELEKKYRKDKLAPYEIALRRQKDMPEIKNKIFQLVFNANPHSQSALYQAIEYTKNCWNDLFTFFNDGHIEMTNNTAERAVKPFVIQRKVFQTSGSYAGASITSKLFSIIQTALINNINVEKYLNYIFENINKEPIENLLPYSTNIQSKLK